MTARDVVPQPAAVAPSRTPLREQLWRSPIDLLPLLSLALALTFAIPPRQVLPGVKYFGRPGLMIVLGLGLCWLLLHLVPRATRARRQPLKWALLAYGSALTLSLASGYLRGLTSTEVNGSVRTMVVTSMYLFMALLVVEGIRDRRRLDRLLNRLVWFASFMAFVGALQFLFKLDLTPKLTLPGLQLYAALITQGERGDGSVSFPRVAGTAGHFIEYGAICALLLPLALHFALHPIGGWQTKWRWTPPIVLGLCIPFSLSRTAAIALGLTVCLLLLGWGARRQATLVASLGIAALVFVAVKPGLLSTFYDLFANSGDDVSVSARTDDYAVTLGYWRERPLLGRGAGTFVVEMYRLLDNQWLGLLVSAGIIGVASLVLLYLTAIRLALATRAQTTDPATANLAMALVSGLVVAAVVSFTFDAFYFTTFGLTVFTLFGACGALWRFNSDAREQQGLGAHASWRDRVRMVRTAAQGNDPEDLMTDPSRHHPVAAGRP